MALATAVAVLLTTHAGRCAGAVPSLSVVNLPTSGTAMAADTQGNIFLTGIAVGLPVTSGAAQGQPGGGTCFLLVNNTIGVPVPCTDAFAAKVVAGTGALVYATYLGGDMEDAGTGIAVDTAGTVYVTGTTAGDFPTTPQAFMRNGVSGVFAAKLNPGGSQFLYSTYLPGTVFQPGTAQAPPAIAVDSSGNAYITGQTATGHAFVAKLSADGWALLYDKTLEGSGADAGAAIAVDADGNAYVTGMTTSPDFPVSAGAFQTRLAGQANAFVAKLDPSGNIVYATYLGGSGSDQGAAVQVDSSGYVYVAGTATSLDFPTTAGSYEPTALVPMWGATPGGFAAKLSPAGDALVYSSYVYGGVVPYWLTPNPAVTSMILDTAGGSYLAGESGPGMPVTATAPQPCTPGAISIVVTHLDAHGALVDRTYFGSYSDVPIGMALSGDHSVLLGTVTALAELNFGDPNTPAASCLFPSVLDAATFNPDQGVAPGEVISLAGFGIGPEQGIAYQPGPGGAAPRQLGGVQVLFDGEAAPLLYVQSQQINAFAPFELASRNSTNVQVVYNGATIGSFVQPVGVAAGVVDSKQNPSLFRMSPGLSTQAAAINEDGTTNGPAHPAPAGSVISLFGTGFGQTQLPGVTGAIFPDEPSPLVTPVAVYIGGTGSGEDYVLGKSAEVLYAGAAPLLFAGVDQINVRVPVLSGVIGGAVEIVVQSLTANGTVTGSLGGTTIWVK